MKWLLLLIVLAASCSTAPKVYTKVEVGMGFGDFHKLCNVDAASYGETVTTAKGSTLTVNMSPTPYPLSNNYSTPRPTECVGKFVFVDGKLESITY